MSKGQYNISGSSKTPPSPSKKANYRRVGNAQNKSPKPVNVHLCYDNKTSRLLMLPNTGADVTVLGTRHLKMMEIHKDSLLPPPLMDTLTADGSQMAPALGCFQATLELGNSRPTSRDETECSEAAAHGRSITSATNITSEDQPSTSVDADRTLQELRTAARADPAYGRLSACVLYTHAFRPTQSPSPRSGRQEMRIMTAESQPMLTRFNVSTTFSPSPRPVPSPSNSDTPLQISVAPCSDEENQSSVHNPPNTPRRSSRLIGNQSARDNATSVRGEGGVDI
ncbi:hypothetical protein Pmani_002041 [Petrolisthes manimaculis]|uniref:Peptidase A2 domain-containing protein n=1 Tax=Petrolisthes manimaculis TaxID=1843537 RepID=A0AAE1UQW9_9EUCA|nr:hypothetical protein Pmani_002041 [Petrolisthes manimaculis]